MSTEFKPTKKQAEEAVAFLNDEIIAPAYFTRLAEHGIQPRTEKEAQQLYQIGMALKGAQTNQTKAASDDNPFLVEALNRINPTANLPAAEMEEYAKAAAEQLPLAKAAALVYAHIAQGGELAEDDE
jgi:hypothetical protein